MKTTALLPALLAGALFAAPATGLSKDKVKVYRDLDGDGHYNKKTYGTGHHHHNSRGYHGYGHGYYDRGYYGRSYYRPYYSRPYSYGYYSYPRTSIGLSFSSPRYTSRDTVYRGTPVYGDDLAVDVQRALARRGYYRGYIDGDVGPGTRAAIRSFQARHGLRVTGRIDSSLIRSLGVG